ncbi:hypothetical protein [Alkaliphilus hydrothermalis]|uniref:Transposase n=1 Tax=Alkaliphilus hydrothermalis TaxID=1482730 RepID=A0ABS2NPV6_9FIRM|nr:hypothetical protein [Alkaliphilus hydrothermalis]MBM7614965.1 hypothetical protein [Alkaliphilus hydrothermalis]
MAKTLCKIVKNGGVKENFEKYIKLIKNPEYVCKSCGRTANESKRLCSPKEI